MALGDLAENHLTGLGMEAVLGVLRAAGEATRLRLLALTAESELTVTELTQILGQSQPRVSRHLKLMCEAGLLERFREGAWVFFRLAQTGPSADAAYAFVDLLPRNDDVLRGDAARLESIKRARAGAAADYFRRNAAQWDQIRKLHVSDSSVENALLDLLGERKIRDFLDVGTGTGRILEIVGPRVGRGTGIDLSREMLAVARTNLEQAGLKNCRVRHADMYSLPFPEASMDAICYHQVLHFADDPAAAVAEGARALRPGGLLVVVDFAPHDIESLREEHAHRRLGFSDQEVAAWFASSGLEMEGIVRLPGDPLTVVVWPAVRRGGQVYQREAPRDA